MKITIGKLKRLIREAMGSPTGSLRKVRGGSQQYKIGKVEDENRELSAFEAEHDFPGSTEAWVEIVPELFPDFPWDDPVAIKKHSVWFKIGNELRVAFSEAPQLELAIWSPEKSDWVETEDWSEN